MEKRTRNVSAASMKDWAVEFSLDGSSVICLQWLCKASDTKLISSLFLSGFLLSSCSFHESWRGAMWFGHFFWSPPFRDFFQLCTTVQIAPKCYFWAMSSDRSRMLLHPQDVENVIFGSHGSILCSTAQVCMCTTHVTLKSAANYHRFYVYCLLAKCVDPNFFGLSLKCDMS